MIQKLLLSALLLLFFTGCNQSTSENDKKSNESELKNQDFKETEKESNVVAKKQTIEDRMENAIERNFDKSNVIYETKVYQFNDSIRISGNKIRVWGHDSHVDLDLSKSGLKFNCKSKLEYESGPLVCWDFQEPNFVIPGHCYLGDSLVLSSRPRIYRGDRPNAWIYDSKSNIKFKIDTRYFDSIFTLIQLSKETFLVLFDDSTKYGEDEYSFRYAIVKLDR